MCIRDRSSELLAATGLDEKHMPSLVEGTDEAGVLRAELASEWGISGRAVVAGGAGDNAASACGMGTVKEGHAFVSLGTSGVLFAANASYLPKPESAVHAFCHALPNTWHQMGVILSATDALNWYSRLTGQSAADGGNAGNRGAGRFQRFEIVPDREGNPFQHGLRQRLAVAFM